MAADLFLMHTDNMEELMNHLPFTLPYYMLEKAKSFRNVNDRNNFIASRWMLQEYFSSVTEHFSFDDLTYTATGKPFYPSGPHFSIAHTKGLAGLLISDYAVGLDIEVIRDIDSIDDYTAVFTGDELSEIKHNGLNTFFRLWTAKEAILKLTGDGITDKAIVHSIKLMSDTGAILGDQYFSMRSFLYMKNFFISIAQTASVATPLNRYNITTIEKRKMMFKEVILPA